MYLYFSDWTSQQRLAELRKKGAPVGNHLIKVYASPFDPSTLLGRELAIVEVSPEEFIGDDIFEYRDRVKITGIQLEEDLSNLHLPEQTRKFVRAIFRFGNREDIACIPYGMEAQIDGNWVFDHPFGPIHGVKEAVARPARRSAAIHLDIFSEKTLPMLKLLVDFDNQGLILSERETVSVISQIRPLGEGSFLAKER